MRKYNKNNSLSIIKKKKKYSVSLEQLDKNNIIMFKEEIKKIHDPRQNLKLLSKFGILLLPLLLLF